MDDDYEGLDITNEGPEDLDTSNEDPKEFSDVFEGYNDVNNDSANISEDFEPVDFDDMSVQNVEGDIAEDIIPDLSELELVPESTDTDESVDLNEDVDLGFEENDVIVDLDSLEEVPEEVDIDDYVTDATDITSEYNDTGEFYTQGINDYGFSGTCGPTSQANTLNVLFDTNEFTENKILDVAVNNDLCNIGETPESSGGTTTQQFMDLYDKVNEGLDDKIQTELFEYDDALDVDEVAEKIEDGGVVNVAVDSSALWDVPRDYVDPLGVPCDDFYSDHWITVKDVHRDDAGNVEGFDIIDSGGGVNYVDADKYHEICFGTDEHKVLDPTTIVVTKDDNEKIER